MKTTILGVTLKFFWDLWHSWKVLFFYGCLGALYLTIVTEESRFLPIMSNIVTLRFRELWIRLWEYFTIFGRKSVVPFSNGFSLEKEGGEINGEKKFFWDEHDRTVSGTVPSFNWIKTLPKKLAENSMKCHFLQRRRKHILVNWWRAFFVLIYKLFLKNWCTNCICKLGCSLYLVEFSESHSRTSAFCIHKLWK